MNFLPKPFSILEKEINAGGVDHVPSTVCLLPACASANTPACVERTGRAGTNKLDDRGSVRQAVENGLLLFMELAP
jgi:hypothetical protein